MAALQAAAPEVMLLQRYFGRMVSSSAGAQMQAATGAMMSQGIARGAQVLGFKQAELGKDLSLNSEHPSVKSTPQGQRG